MFSLPHAVTYDESGTTAAKYYYDAWGKLLSGPTSAVGTANPLRYRGYYYDSETGFYYLQSRYYDPAICRFINADAFASTGQGMLGYNMFAYCGNNSVNNSDVTGQFFFTALGAVTGFVSGAATAMMSGADKETWFETACHSAVGGAIAGAGVDTSLLLIGSCGMALPVVALAGGISFLAGGLGNAYTTAATSNGEASNSDMWVSFLLGGAFNVASLLLSGTCTASTLEELFFKGINDFNANLGAGMGIAAATGIATYIGTSMDDGIHMGSPNKPFGAVSMLM